MAIGTGLAAQLGLVAEVTYGTYVAPTRFLEFKSEDLKYNKTTVQGGGLAAGRYVDLGSRRVVTTQGGSGSVNLEVTNKSFGLFLEHLLGSVATAQQGTTAAYKHTYTVADTAGKSLTVQKGVPDTTGTVNPYSFTGGKITSAGFSCDVEGTLEAEVEFDFKGVTEAQSLAAASYTSGIAPFHGGQMNVKVGTYNSEAAISGVKKVDVKIERPLDTERFYASGTAPASKAEPLMNGMLGISGSITTDLVDKTDLADLFVSDADTSLVVEWVGPLIASTFYETFRITVPMIFIDSETPSVNGPEIVNTSYAFTGQYDGTNGPVIIEYITTDTTS